MTPTGGAAPGPTPAFPWDDALHFALSRLGWRPAEFWAASPRELAAAIGSVRETVTKVVGELSREGVITQTGLRFLALKDIVPLEGGLPLMLDGKIVGAIGVSGVLSSQDAQIAKAGADALK